MLNGLVIATIKMRVRATRKHTHARIEANMPILVITVLSLVLATGASGAEYVLGDAVIGRWDVVTNVLGKDRHSVLGVAEKEGAHTATLNDEEDGEIEVTAIGFEDGILSYEYVAPQSQLSCVTGKGNDKASSDSLIAWLKVTGDTIKGALSSETKEIDYSIEGQRRGTTPAAH